MKLLINTATILITKTTTLVKTLGLTLSLVLSGALLSSNAFASGNAANGKSLFTGSKCGTCHGTEIYTSKDRKVKNLKALEAAVRLNDSKLNTNWFDEDVKDVTAYLNQQYYKF